MSYENKIDPLTGVLSTLGLMASGDMSHRGDMFRDGWDAVIVDTVAAPDTGAWETGISRNSGESWDIVQQYPDRNEAQAGHDKWVEQMRDTPEMELTDVNVWNIPEETE